MKPIKFVLIIIVGLFLISAFFSNGKPIDTPAINGTQSQKRIIAGTVAAMLYLDFLEADLAGVINTSSVQVPERYADTPAIGLPMSPNTEIVLSLEPDIYVGELLLQPIVEEILKMGPSIEAIYLSGSSYDSIAQNIILLSEALNLEDKSREINELMQANLEKAKEIAKGKQVPSVAILFGTPDSFSLASNKTFSGDVLNLIGAQNIADIVELESGYINFDREKLAEMNPDIILRLSHGGADMIDELKKTFDEAYNEPYWQGLSAVKSGRVYDLDPSIFGVTVNLNSLQAPVEMAKLIYGDK